MQHLDQFTMCLLDDFFSWEWFMFFPVFIGNYLDYILDIVNNKLYKLWIFLYFLKSIFFLSSFFFFSG